MVEQAMKKLNSIEVKITRLLKDEDKEGDADGSEAKRKRETKMRGFFKIMDE